MRFVRCSSLVAAAASALAALAPLTAQQAVARQPIAQQPAGARWLDLDGDTARQVTVRKDPAKYLGHPTTVLLPDGDGNALSDPLWDARSDAEKEGDKVPVADGATEGLPLNDAKLRDPHGEALKLAEPLLDSDGDALGEPLGQARRDADTLLHREAVAEGQEEGLPLGDAESRGDAVRVNDPVPLRVPVAETLAHSVALKEAVRE